MKRRFYLDTCIWRDYYENRSDNFRPLGEWALFLINKINQAKIYSPNGNSILINFKKPDFVVDRKNFDQYLANMAKSKGATYHLNSRYESNDDKQVIVNGIRIKSDKIIGADGPFSRVAKNNNLWCNRKFVTGHQFTLKTNCEKDLVEFWLGINMFGWLVPENETTARVGVVTSYSSFG